MIGCAFAMVVLAVVVFGVWLAAVGVGYIAAQLIGYRRPLRTATIRSSTVPAPLDTGLTPRRAIEGGNR